MDDTATLTAEIRARVAQLGFELVDLRQRGTPRRVVLQVRVDRPDAEPGHGITIEECATISRALEAWLDEAQVLGPRYALEVSSPGIERPVRWREHWERFAGREVNVRLDPRRRLRATIVGVVPGADSVILKPADGGEAITVALDQVREATLVVDWDAVERSAARRKRH
jgi:ribosome maturation factor RimP